MRKRKQKIPRCHIIFSVIVTVVLLVAGYFLNESNNLLFWNEEQLSYTLFQEIKNLWETDEVYAKDDALFVDVSGAKTIIDKKYVPDHCPDTIRDVVADRRLLLEFLRKLEEADRESKSYSYLFIDLEFDTCILTQCDTELVEQLLKMPRVAIAKSQELVLIDKRLDSIAFFVNYPSQPFDNRFEKYNYIQNGENSAALEMYRCETSNKHTIRKFGWLYYDRWRLAHNSLSLAFHCEGDDNNPYRHDIRCILNNTKDWNRFSAGIKGKFVIVGNFEEDKVCTYMGEQSGTFVNWIAFLSLKEGKHKVNPLCVILLMIAYFSLTLLILRKHFIQSLLAKLNPAVQFICSLVGYGVILWLLSMVLYLCWGILYSTLLPTVVFTLISNYIQFRNNKRSSITND